MNKQYMFVIIVTILVIGIGYLADAPYRKLVAEFTKKCHEQNGVVVAEYDTKNLLCFPADIK